MTKFREIKVSFPEDQYNEGDFDHFVDMIHDYYAYQAIISGRQSFGDCGDYDGPGCEGCNIIGSTTVEEL